MKNCSSIKAGLLIITIILLISSIVAPMTIGYNVRTSDNKVLAEIYKFDRYLLPEFYDRYNIDEIPDSEKYINREHSDNDNIHPETVINPDKSPQLLDGPPMNSPWPMYCHDVRHTGRSPYSTVDNFGLEKWNYRCGDYSASSPVIDDDGNIYFSSFDDHLYSLYPNGTLKWKHDIGQRWTQSAPAIDESGIIYLGTSWSPSGGDRLYAIYPNGTRKWTIHTGQIFSSPTIGDNGIIYFGDCNYNINALYSNGTLKWRYTTGMDVFSSPAIGLDGTIYCGSLDNYVYALYPNNGTLKWRFNTGNWVHGSPSIGDDGTVYIGSDANLFALYPNNGTMKWKLGIGGVWGSPALDENGILYVGVWEGKFFAIYPNGTIKWSFDVGNRIWWTSPALSIDGTIYFGTCIGDWNGGEIIALNPDGTLKWRNIISNTWVWSAPAIGDGETIYISSTWEDVGPGGVVTDYGYLHAIGKLDDNAPSTPEIDGPMSGRPNIEYDYTFNSSSPLNRNLYYYIDWGDNTVSGWLGPNNSGEEITVSHTWFDRSTYTIKARAKDTDNLWGPWGFFEVEIPRNKVSYNSLFLRFLERFTLLERLFSIFK